MGRVSDRNQLQSGKDTVSALIKRLDPAKQKNLNAIRRIIKRAAPDLTEGIKWGNICYWRNGNVIWFLAYRDYLDFGFFKGAKLTNPQKQLEGTGKGLRHIKIRSAKDIDPPYFTKLVKEAVQLDR